MSACVAELMAAGQSTLGLIRWHSFQSYLRSLDSDSDESLAHVKGVQTKTDTVLFPNLKEAIFC